MGSLPSSAEQRAAADGARRAGEEDRFSGRIKTQTGIAAQRGVSVEVAGSRWFPVCFSHYSSGWGAGRGVSERTAQLTELFFIYLFI